MATLTHASSRTAGPDGSERARGGRRRSPRLGRWLRLVLDRPLTSYHLVLGSVALLLVVGVMMVLSASSVNAYLTTGDSYFYVKRQLIFLAVGADRRAW